MSQHSVLSPSAAERWWVCGASVNSTKNLPRRTSIEAAEGTLLHEVAGNCLELGLEPFDFVGCTMDVEGYTFEFDDDHASCMQPRLDWLREQPGHLFIERRVSLDPWLPGNSGVLDIGIAQIFEGIVTILDWKFGVGIPVSPVKNKQLMLYALGFVHTILTPKAIVPKRFRIIIEQPRCPGGGGEWEISYDDLLAFGEEAKARGKVAMDPDAPFVASEQGCFWCGLNPKNGGKGCEELERFNLDTLSLKFDDMDEGDAIEAAPPLPNLSKMTPERRSYVYRHSKMVTGWLEAIHTGLLDDAINGRPTPGLKAVAGRMGARYYRDEAAAEAILVPALHESAFTKKLKSPAQAENEMLPKRGKPGHPDAWLKLDAIISQDDGKPALVPVDDERPALLIVDQKFEDV